MTSNKLLIVVLGVSNSYTSMIAKFLLDNGAAGGEFCPERDDEYPRYENKYLKLYEDSMQKFEWYNLRNAQLELEDHINSLEDDVVMIKGSWIGYDLRKFNFNRRVKIVYCLRNPKDIIDANMERSNLGFAHYFDNYCDFYDMITKQVDVFPIITERIREDFPELLVYCELLEGEGYDYFYDDMMRCDLSSIKPFKKRNASYIKHRIKSFWKKQLYD